VGAPDEVRETEVCIVGAGAAGGIMALELARRGIRVVVLESGPHHDLARRGEYSRRFARGENPWLSPLAGIDRYTTGGSLGYRLEWNRARGVGGSTLHWEGTTLRLRTEDFRMRSLHGVAEDWPISYEEIEPYYGKAERALGVAGTPDDPWASARSTAAIQHERLPDAEEAERMKTYWRETTQRLVWKEEVCAEVNQHVKIGKEFYKVDANGYLMPTRKDQAAPDLRHFRN
jgi:choline dehydrogenase-like flavoprotein